MGDPDEIADFIGDARDPGRRIWRPCRAAMLERLPGLKLIAVSRGGPVNIDMEAARERGVLVVNTPGRNASAVAEFTIGAILAETRLIRAATKPARGRMARRSLPRRPHRPRAVRDDGRRRSATAISAPASSACSRRSAAASWSPIPTSSSVAQDRDDGVEHVGLDALLARGRRRQPARARDADETTRLHRRRRARRG